MLIVLQSKDGDAGYVIGAVETNLPEVEANEFILELWIKFQETHPDCDSEFVEWLDNRENFRSVVPPVMLML